MDIQRLPRLPVSEVLGPLGEALATHGRAILAAPPGSGKTTLAPLALMDADWLRGARILMLEPRRLAARAAARRMADLLGEPVGARVGYRVRLDHRTSAATRIEVVTEGILTRMLQADPELSGVGLIIFDEFHERSLHADLALALTLDVIQGLREDLRLLIMSATLDREAVARLLDTAPVIDSQGRTHPVEVRYASRSADRSQGDLQPLIRTVQRALQETAGDLLVFLPGAGEIRRLAEALGGQAGLRICPLYGDLPQPQQDQALFPDPDGCRRAVLATNLAETSLTIEGVQVVVDSGLERVARFDPNTGLDRLQTARISAASAAQRAGRAGRLGPGVCYRLWTEAEQRRLAPHAAPEILRSDLAPLALELARWGTPAPDQLRWLDAPPGGHYAGACDLLRELGALDPRGRLTADGEAMARLPAHPRLAHLLLRGRAAGLGDLAADLAALIEERDPLRGQAGADLEDRLRLLQDWRERGLDHRQPADLGALQRIDRMSRRWREEQAEPPRASALDRPQGGVGALLALAYPDRVAQRSADGRYRLASGRAARLAADDPLGLAETLVVVRLDAGQREGRIFQAARLTPAELEWAGEGRIRESEQVAWDAAKQRVEAVAERRWGALVLGRRRLRAPPAEAVAAALLDGIRQAPSEILPWTPEARQWQARVASLRHWQPDADWPDLSDHGLWCELDLWLGPWIQGMSGRDPLQKLDLAAILRARLDWPRQQAVELLAPTRIQVPSGGHRPLAYRPGEAPVLAVRLQEMFGLLDTPRVCDGAVPVLLHLLSPARRPIQVTSDLRGFWERTYPEVKKELKGRYPKHYWPADPFAAEPITGVRPKGPKKAGR